MGPLEMTPLLKKLRREPLCDPKGTAEVVDYGRQDIERILPHRDPFLLIDGSDRVDVKERTIRGHRRMSPDDPVFGGHFPKTPVYPGVLQVEMTGQLGLCLVHFIGHRTHRITEDAAPADVRALRVHHAQYLLPVVPGDLVEVHAALVEEDAMTATCAGQVVRDGKVASFAVQEVYFVE